MYLILPITLLITRYVERLEPEGEWEESVRQRKWFPIRLNGFLKLDYRTTVLISGRQRKV